MSDTLGQLLENFFEKKRNLSRFQEVYNLGKHNICSVDCLAHQFRAPHSSECVKPSRGLL